MNIPTNKWLLIVYPNKLYYTIHEGCVFGADPDNTYIEFDSELDMENYIKENRLVKDEIE